VPNEQEILSFKGLASYYRRFVKKFLRHIWTLSAMTSDKVPFLGISEQNAFDQLKEALDHSSSFDATGPEGLHHQY
jgi:hypothetical protein